MGTVPTTTPPIRGLWPAIPDNVADDMAVLRYTRLRAHAPIQYLVMIVVVFAAMFIGSPAVPAAVRFGIPIAVISLSLWRLFYWVVRSPESLSATEARRMTRFATFYSTGVATFCSCWAIGSCLSLSGDMRAYYALLMVVGSVSATLCVSSIRFAAYANMIAGMAPVTALLLLNGQRLDNVAAAVIVAAAAYMVRMVHQQHEQTVQLLQLQRQMHALAYTDPLTGVANRRAMQQALSRALDAAKGSGQLAVALLDLNGFKPVNDCFGHAAGDALLRQVAQRLSSCADNHVEVARLGGDEFAILMEHRSPDQARAFTDQLLASLATPFVIDGQQLRIGASAGVAHWPADGTDCEQLLDAADRALYRAKALVRGDGASTQPLRNAWVMG